MSWDVAKKKWERRGMGVRGEEKPRRKQNLRRAITTTLSSPAAPQSPQRLTLHATNQKPRFGWQKSKSDPKPM